MGKQGKFDSRSTDEKTEGGQMIDSNVPDTRFQSKQQVEEPVRENAKAKPGSNPFVARESDSKGSQLKQEKVAEVITGVGGVAPDSGLASPSKAGLRTLAYSGNEGTILGSPSGTPVVGAPSRSDTRPGQKLDAVAKAIDFIASEQVLQKFDGSKPLQDNPGEVQGFLGHPENQAARAQKVAEAVPGALLFARSCDEIARDEIVYAEGQMIRESDIEYKVEPQYTYDKVAKAYKPFTSRRGNFIPKTLQIGVASNGEIVSFAVDTDDVSVTTDAEIVNQASSSFIRAMNIDEINRQNMEKVAGVETEKNWCPLVRATYEPTAIIGHLTDHEIACGSEDFMAYRFLNKAMSYQFNKAAKDGQVPYRSFKEILYGLTAAYHTSADISDNRINFSILDYLRGSPSLMIALYDSIAKYSKRGDIFTQPRSFKMHKQTADNNINPFKVHPDFAKYVVNRDVFSTIDRGYDPFLPVCISDNWRVSHTLDFGKMINIAKTTRYVAQMGGKGVVLAGTAFDNIYDTASERTAIIHGYASSSAQTGNIYNYLGMAGSLNYGNAKLLFAGNKSGFNDYDDGLAAANALLDALEHAGNNAQLTPHVVLFKVKDTVDEVYAVMQSPGVWNLNTSSPNAIIYVAHSTTEDYLYSDVTKGLTAIKTLNLDVDQLVYKYHNRQNDYIVEVKNPLLYGILEWARNLGAKLRHPSTSHGDTAEDQGNAQGVLIYRIPIVHSTTNISLWDMIVCASVPFAQKIRTNSMFDVLNYEDANGKYPFAQLISISEANPLTSVNYTFKDILQPLQVGMMKNAVALSWIMPEKFWRIAHTYSGGAMTSEKFVLPFYFNEEKFRFWKSAGTIYCGRADDGYVMNFPSTRAGARLSFTDQFYGMTERDVRLCLDMMVDIPGGKDALNQYSALGVYKYGLSNSGIPVVEYTNLKPLTIGTLLKTPREIGLGCVAPVGYNMIADATHTTNHRVDYTSYKVLDDLVSAGTSYRVRTWKVQGGSYQALHDALSTVITRGGNFSQDWTVRGDCVYADADNTSVEAYGTLDKPRDIGICLNFNDAMEVTSGEIVGEEGTSVFKPFTEGDNTNNSNLPSIITLQNVLWTRLQVLPFSLSPFDQTPEGRLDDGSHVTVDMTADPYDFMVMFGFCGFKTSDYREDVYNRIYEKQTLGWTYITDPFVVASPVLK